MRTAYEKGYDVITLTDCTAATSAEEQQSATSQDYPMFSQPMTSDEVVESLRAAVGAFLRIPPESLQRPCGWTCLAHIPRRNPKGAAW